MKTKRTYALEGRKKRIYIIGGGVTGLAAGTASGLPVLEAASHPGGICASYYVAPHSAKRLASAPKDGEAYRFEIGGGHWIFGGRPAVLRMISRLVPTKIYLRRSSVFFPERKAYVPFPIQNHLSFFGARTARRALEEMRRGAPRSGRMLKDWLSAKFGKTLCDLFFHPFHERYTAGLYHRTAPQDEYKSPVDISRAEKGACGGKAPATGYNISYRYPEGGLDRLARRLAERCRIQYEHRVSAVDLRRRELVLESGRSMGYDALVSTVPLNDMLRMTGLDRGGQSSPYTSVLVLNIGAEKGECCPEDHWVYTAGAKSGFHRVGFYSNVDPSFLPRSDRKRPKRAGVYVEKAFANGKKPTRQELRRTIAEAVAELQAWGYIGKTEVVDPTWIRVGYTWSLPGSSWKDEALKRLSDYGIYSVGRYGAWKFQGIAESIDEGLGWGARVKRP